MPVLVQKYGGSSVANIDKIKLVAEQVVQTKSSGFDVVVVVSAMGNTTDDLITLARQINPEPANREMDMLVTVGERITMALLSMAIDALGHRSISLTGSQCGIITNASAGGARIIDVRPFRVQDELSGGKIVIVAGYQGMSYKREVTTLGRGGSDTTAVALAAALGADTCELYSDVDGVYTADPSTVISAKKLSHVSYDEMIELSRFGAQVLNAEAVTFAKETGIALYAKKMGEQSEGTQIGRPDDYPEHLLESEKNAFVTGISGRRDVIMVSVDDPADAQKPYDKLLEAAGDLNLLFSSGGSNSYMALFSTEDRTNKDHLARALISCTEDGEFEITQNCAVVTIVGDRINRTAIAMKRMLSSLKTEKITPYWLEASGSHISAIIPENNIKDALNCLHKEFIR
jgi:aspartate kinase